MTGANTGLAGSAGALGATFKRLFFFIGGAIALKKAVGVLTSFEDTMAQLQGVTNATAEQMDMMSRVARDLGASTRFSASQAAEGLLALSRAGFTVEESTAAIAETLNLATAAMIDLGRASEITSNTIRQFQLRANEAGRVADVFVNTANSANTTVELLAETMKFAGSVAGVLGISLEETAAAAGVLANAGIQGTMAGTALRMIMLSLLKPTTEAKRVFQEMGIVLDEINPERVGIIGAFERLREANLTTAQAAGIFQKRFAGAALILKENVDVFEELIAANEESMGVSRRNAALIEDTLSGAFKELKSAIEEATLSAGDAGLLGVLKEVVRFTTDIVRALSGVETGASIFFARMQFGFAVLTEETHVFVTESIAGWKMIFEVVKSVGAGIATTMLKAIDGILFAFRKLTRGVIDSQIAILETMRRAARHIEGPTAEALRKSIQAMRQFKADASDALDIDSDRYKQTIPLAERQAAIVDETGEKVKKIRSEYKGVRQELAATMNALQQQKDAAEKVQDAVTGTAEAMSQATTGAGDDISDLTKKTEKMSLTMENVMGAASSSLIDLAMGASSFEDAILSATDAIIRMALQMALMQAFAPAAAAAGGAPVTGAKGLVAMQAGGIVRGPTAALIGERGPEAVIPLERDESGVLGISGGGTVVNETNFTLVSPDAGGIRSMLLRDPKLIQQMNTVYEQGYAID